MRVRLLWFLLFLSIYAAKDLTRDESSLYCTNESDVHIDISEFGAASHEALSLQPMAIQTTMKFPEKQFYRLKIAGSDYHNSAIPLTEVFWAVRTSPQITPNNLEYLLIDDAIVEVVANDDLWLELKNGWTLYRDPDHNHQIMWQQITDWTSEFEEFDEIIPGCVDRVKWTLARTENSICHSKDEFAATIAGIAISQFGCTAFGGFVRDFIFRNEEVVDLDLCMPKTTPATFLGYFSAHLLQFDIELRIGPVYHGVTKTTISNRAFSIDVDFINSQGFSGIEPTCDFDVNNFQLATFGRENKPILFQRAPILKSNREVVQNIKYKTCSIITRFCADLKYSEYLRDIRVPKMQSKEWFVANIQELDDIILTNSR